MESFLRNYPGKFVGVIQNVLFYSYDKVQNESEVIWSSKLHLGSFFELPQFPSLSFLLLGTVFDRTLQHELKEET